MGVSVPPCVSPGRPYPPTVRPPADAIGTLSLIVGAIALVIFIGAERALVYAIWRYRPSRHVAGERATVQRHRSRGSPWAPAPAVLLAVVFVAARGTMA